MHRNPADVVNFFFEITDQTIKEDFLRCKTELPIFQSEIDQLESIPESKKMPTQKARLIHLMLIKGRLFSQLENIPSELRIANIDFVLGDILRYVETLTMNKGTCAKLSAVMESIREREGLTEKEFWCFTKDAPEDYQELSEELLKTVESVTDTVFSFILSKYGFQREVEMFDTCRSEFDIQREIGRRVLYDDSGEHDALLDPAFEKLHGAKALHRLKQRILEIKKECFPL